MSLLCVACFRFNKLEETATFLLAVPQQRLRDTTSVTLPESHERRHIRLCTALLPSWECLLPLTGTARDVNKEK